MSEFVEALAIAQKWVGAVAGVVMVGQGRDTIDVWVTRDDVDLPDEVLGVPVRVVPTGEIKAH
ncbi:MAG TPA: hypothetical protein VFC19_13875 [Candidatus Limnocylindrales bacterium]|nr:hypothetical protein [Candidatus Limnocylindrales bacterium]